MDKEIVTFIIIGILIILFMVKTCFLDPRSDRKVLKPLLTFLNVSLVSSGGNPYLKGEYKGVEIGIGVPWGRRDGKRLEVHMRTEHSFRMSAEKRKFVIIPFGKEVKTSDDQFDKKFLMYTNDEVAAINYMNDGQKLQSISFLLSNEYASHFKVNTQKKNYITAFKRDYKEEDLTKKRLTTVLDHLCLLTR